MNRVSVQIDSRRRSVTFGGRTTVLQDKSWQVFTMLLQRAPAVISREDFVSEVWQGNFRTGEKGLNQAVWAIRAALGEEPQEPKFIRTLPRVGYRWIGSSVSTGDNGQSMPAWGIGRKVSGISTLAATFALVVYMNGSAYLIDAEAPTTPPDMVATKAYLVGRDIHVEFASGCLGILKNASDKDIGTPVLSLDGTEVAVTLREPESCRLVTIDVISGKRKDFGNCPVI